MFSEFFDKFFFKYSKFMKPYSLCKFGSKNNGRHDCQIDEFVRNLQVEEKLPRNRNKSRVGKPAEKRPSVRRNAEAAAPIEIPSGREQGTRKRKRETSEPLAAATGESSYFLRSGRRSGSSSLELPVPNEARRKKIKPNSSSSSESKTPPSAPPVPPSAPSPDPVDATVSFESIGGLREHIDCLKEMIVLPTLYPDVFRKYNVQPPRGILFHGPPGTGKTLMARAVATECNIGTRKIAFFMRKGSDLLSEWIGESERNLRRLFEEASASRPSIIFFDEIDGLAPVRSSRQDYVHASMVSTLLALMDGIEARGEVIVIGATNRIDAIDPALRRPGRFDRELLFSLPGRDEREKILRVHTGKWQTRPSNETLVRLAEKTVGYCGSDLKSLCGESVIQCLRRSYPAVYASRARLDIDVETVCVEQRDFDSALALIVPAQRRVEPQLSRKLLDFLRPIFAKANSELKARLGSCFPHSTQLQLSKVKITDRRQQARLLVCADGDDQGHTTHLAAHLLFDMEHLTVFPIDVERLKRHSGTNAIEAFVQIFRAAQSSVPSVVFVPEIDRFWTLIDDTLKTVLLSKFISLDASVPILLLATANVPYDQLPCSVTTLFSRTRHEIYEFAEPNAAIRRQFFAQLFAETATLDPLVDRKRKRVAKKTVCDSRTDTFLEDCVQLTNKYPVQQLIDLFHRLGEVLKKPHDSLESSIQDLKQELTSFSSGLLLNVASFETKLMTCPAAAENGPKTYFS